ncbi:MAG: ACT domain-containing protein [Lachnospiraceae bacterium]|nr:ACT domain-containing protein [Lachnospiraceae bacterium]
MKKAVITVVGHDTVGIIASVCTYLAEQNVNILDISQTIVDGYFNMMMIADVTEPKSDFLDIVTGLDEIGKKVGVMVHCQREDIFDSMHRLS